MKKRNRERERAKERERAVEVLRSEYLFLMWKRLFGLARQVMPRAPNLWMLPKYHFYYSSNYVQPWEITPREIHDLSWAIIEQHNCWLLGQVLQENLGIITEKHLTLAL